MCVKDYYHERMVRVYDPEDKNIGSEIIHLLLDTLPPTNIMGVYQETGITSEQIEDAHRVLRNKVKKCEESGRVCILMYMYMYNSFFWTLPLIIKKGIHLWIN